MPSGRCRPSGKAVPETHGSTLGAPGIGSPFGEKRFGQQSNGYDGQKLSHQATAGFGRFHLPGVHLGDIFLASQTAAWSWESNSTEGVRGTRPPRAIYDNSTAGAWPENSRAHCAKRCSGPDLWQRWQRLGSVWATNPPFPFCLSSLEKTSFQLS